MGVQSTVGVVSGIDYGTMIDSLIKISQQPQALLASRNDTLKQEQVAVTTLSAYLLSTQYTSDNLAQSAIYGKRQATSSNASALSATVTGAPEKGTYQFTAVRTAVQQQFLGSGISSDTASLGGGTVTLRFGDNVQRSSTLDVLNGGSGVQRGKIRITDRSGASAEIDLSSIQTVDDVLDAINSSTGINVTATTHGGAIRLIDNTGQTVSDLKVQEVGRGKTAASLGLAGIDSAADVADGQDLRKLTNDTLLGNLNDGKGVRVSTVLPDISYALRDGTTGSIDFTPLGSSGETAQKENTLADILKTINAAAPNKLKAEISSDGKRLVVSDLTTGDGSTSLQSQFNSPALANLGLDGAAVNGVITGRDIVGGLGTVLLSSLKGGKGVGQLGSLQLTDRSGATASVDLSHAETLESVIEKINAAGIGITAAVNDAKNGIRLSDTTNMSTSHLIVADADSSGTAAALGIAVDADQTSVNSGDLHLQVVSENTKLSSLNGGAGVAKGKFTITTSAGSTTDIDLTKNAAQTVGDVIKLINQQSGTVLAKINDTGDGILLTDLEHGAGAFTVTDSGSTTAADLHLTGTAKVVTSGGTSSNVINGSITQTIQLGANDSLSSLQAKIAALGMGVTASNYNDGSNRPYHLSLTSQKSGRLAQFVVDTSGVGGLQLTETSRAHDALLAVGSSGGGIPGVLLASANNQFTSALPGATLTINQASPTPVTITVGSSDTDLVAGVQALVNNYNKFRTELNTDTKYDATQNKGAVLFGDGAALRLDTELPGLLTGRITGAGAVQTLNELGVTLGSDGTLGFDQTVLQSKYADNPQGVQDFFTKKDVGFSAKLSALVQQMAGKDVSLLAQRYKALDNTINNNQTKIDDMTKRLENQRTLLTKQFAQVEIAISKMKSTMSMLSSIQLISADGSSSSTSSSSSSSKSS